MRRRVLVTGGAGFIGSHVADAYLAAGCDVTIIDNLSHGRPQNVPKGAEFKQLDVGSEEGRALVAGGGFEVIAHLAAQVDVRVSVADPIFDAEENLLALLNLLEGARAGGTRRIVFSSSGGVVYGERKPPHVETTPKLPLSPYGVSKLAAEHYLVAYAQLYGIEAVALRVGKALTIYGDGSQTRDYVFVADVARANVLAADAALPAPDGTVDARAFNIGTGVETSVTALAQAMIAAAGSKVGLDHAPARAGELLANALTAAKAEKVLGWKPQVTLADGLRRTYDWIKGDAA